MFLSLQLLYWSSWPKFILPIKSMSVLLVGAETYIYIIPSFTLGAGPWYGPCDTSGQAAMEVHGPYRWCRGWYKDSYKPYKPCFARWPHDGCKTWECWDTANQRGSLGKSFSLARHHQDLQRCGGMHQQKLSRGAAAGRGARQPPLAMAAPCAGLGSTARGEGGQPACEGWGGHCLCPSPQLCAEKTLSELSSPGQRGSYLPQRGMLWLGKVSQAACSGASTLSTAAAVRDAAGPCAAACRAWWEGEGDFGCRHCWTSGH